MFYYELQPAYVYLQQVADNLSFFVLLRGLFLVSLLFINAIATEYWYEFSGTKGP